MIGQGGYSYVYLATEQRTGQKYALKKVLCQVEEQREMVLKEISVHEEFRHPNLMPLLDLGWTRAPNGGDIAWLLLPLIEGGSLRNVLDKRLGLGDYLGRGTGGLPELEIFTLFWGICKGVEALHNHHPAWAHRDLKPDNVMLQADNTPVIMDFGSVAPADVVVTNRTEALQLQDAAAQFCTMSYRAPELFDVASDSVVDSRTDVWSLGCTLYAMAFGYSPFESEISANGQIRVVDCTFLRVKGGKVIFPTYHRYSEDLLDLIRYMLQQDPKKRPHIADILDKLAQMKPELQNLTLHTMSELGSTESV
eukprot:CAMPEP_0117829032 /NCGR_PEP_ID=MMETSP0949-20121206/7623_1 /TAXON_ID=44440 /ORGANISM="Chattonella subsalsa, Strain CCMP2191" /LENGTH=307 /DNA_ID=CAMNT_0005669703 /DNA_START=75 /DNA_END=999 /DNA_ORIENTATION=+